MRLPSRSESGVPPVVPESRPIDALDEEKALIEGLQRGCHDSFERVVRRFAPRLLATIRRIVGHEADAHDALQDTFLSAHRSIHLFHHSARLSTWLHRIAVNAALMKLRSQRRRPVRSIEELLPRYHADGHRVDPKEAWTRDHETALEQHEQRALLGRCLEQLPDEYRTVLLLRDIEELETSDVAALLGITAGAVKTRLHRARQALRTLLEHEFLP